jgi:hypothetical protein
MARHEPTKSAYIIAIACVAMLGAGARIAEACACVVPNRTAEQERQNVSEQLAKSLAVFSGEVAAKDPGLVRFKLEKVWKGDFAGELTMQDWPRQNPDGSISLTSCDYVFTIGKKDAVLSGLSGSTRRTPDRRAHFQWPS